MENLPSKANLLTVNCVAQSATLVHIMWLQNFETTSAYINADKGDKEAASSVHARSLPLQPSSLG